LGLNYLPSPRFNQFHGEEKEGKGEKKKGGILTYAEKLNLA